MLYDDYRIVPIKPASSMELNLKYAPKLKQQDIKMQDEKTSSFEAILQEKLKLQK